ncbi:MAG TPA: hypothetical protein VG457_00465 [Planctomycetota bacterium]|jgi:hypothetical protein|nr:hypothetical protein [Planctomycetota bacterium]
MTISFDHPLVVRLREISAVLRKISEIEGQLSGDAPAAGKVSSFYEGSRLASSNAAKLIDDAIAEHTKEPFADPFQSRLALRRAIACVSHKGKFQLIDGGRR